MGFIAITLTPPLPIPVLMETLSRAKGEEDKGYDNMLKAKHWEVIQGYMFPWVWFCLWSSLSEEITVLWSGKTISVVKSHPLANAVDLLQNWGADLSE